MTVECVIQDCDVCHEFEDATVCPVCELKRLRKVLARVKQHLDAGSLSTALYVINTELETPINKFENLLDLTPVGPGRTISDIIKEKS